MVFGQGQKRRLWVFAMKLAEVHHETLDSGFPHRRRFCGIIPCLRGRQDYRSGPRRLRKPVADILQSHGYSVLVVQEPETSFAADVAATRRVLDKAGPCVLVGHSYGGMIITEAGMHPDVKSLVYVAAVQPDIGESLADLADKMPPANKSIEPVGEGFLAVNPDAFPTDFAADAPKPVSRFIAISPVPA